LLEASQNLGVPLRECTSLIRHCGDFYGQTAEGESFLAGTSIDHLIRLIEALPPGWTELGCHPGFSDSPDSIYSAERENEVRVLCDPRIREVISRRGVQLRSFHELDLAPGRT
jgi:predicted glycoside hydrolase/deacetylase ChbG (UPF0249 family)